MRPEFSTVQVPSKTILNSIDTEFSIIVFERTCTVKNSGLIHFITTWPRLEYILIWAKWL